MKLEAHIDEGFTKMDLYNGILQKKIRLGKQGELTRESIDDIIQIRKARGLEITEDDSMNIDPNTGIPWGYFREKVEALYDDHFNENDVLDILNSNQKILGGNPKKPVVTEKTYNALLKHKDALDEAAGRELTSKKIR